MMFDLIIRNGLIIDGTGRKAYTNDIGINGEYITTIGSLNNIQGKNEINANGLVIAPGFIDAHAHSDGILLYDPQHANGIRQGITTEILGQDGLSYAPLSDKNYKIQRQYLNGILGSPPENLNMKTVKNFKANDTKIDDQKIDNILTVNGVRFSLEDGSWGLIRASSNKPSLVVVTESPTSDKRKKKIFEFIDKLLKQTGRVGEYDQKI